VRMNTIIEKLKSCSSEEKYRMQIIILNRIVQTSTILDEKTKTFWQYVLDDADNWRFHHSIVLNLIATYSIISRIINAVKKKKDVYRETLHTINQFWKKEEQEYVVHQFLKMLWNMRKIAIKS
jgi:hypothetical protein